MTATAIYPSLKDRVVFITGGGSGIGASIVEHFCQQGARVGFVDIDEAASEALVAEVAKAGHAKPLFVKGDITDIPARRAAIAKVREALGPITSLVNYAANDQRHPLDEVTPEFWDDRIAVNLKHQFFAAQAIHPDMAAAGGGAIVNLGSVSWIIGQGGMPCYTTAKSAVAGLTRALARDLGPQNIRVNCVVPGWIMTQRQIDLWLNKESEAELMQRQCL
jgi:NAD(P)-dependent dehydrogenase (short-subunit alcohol dehydrogenase family)